MRIFDIYIISNNINYCKVVYDIKQAIKENNYKIEICNIKQIDDNCINIVLKSKYIKTIVKQLRPDLFNKGYLILINDYYKI